jgi:hypothetical protein
VTGIDRPRWNFRRLRGSVDAFDRLIEIHYRYYQWHANSLVAITITAASRWTAHGFSWKQFAVLAFVDSLLLAGSRDTLAKYYQRAGALLGRR